MGFLTTLETSMKLLLPLLGFVLITCAGTGWGQDTSPTAAAPATSGVVTAAPATAAPASQPKSVEERLAAVEATAKAANDSATSATFNSGDNAWLLTSSLLVLLMTLPGLALFYGGLVRKKNVLGTMMQSLAIACLVSVIWAVFGYSFAFGPGSSHNQLDDKGSVVKDGAGLAIQEPNGSASVFGGFKYAMLDKVVTDVDHRLPSMAKDKDGNVALKDPDANASFIPGPYAGYAASVPHGTFMLFQLMFAIITPALICGAFAERMKFSAMLLFITGWFLVVYLPMAHMVWGENGYFNWGFNNNLHGAFDFAGGTVVHISSGIAALMACVIMGKRKNYLKEIMPPHNLTYSFIGACMLWVGWFGFNAGSALSASGLATLAFANTHFATAAAAIGWPLAEWLIRGKPTVLGAISGAVAGLVAITPAAGFVTPGSALAIGLIAGFLCFTSTSYLKQAFGYDDSLDAFGVHGVGGTWGAIATGLFFNVEANPGVRALNPSLYTAILNHEHPVIFNQIKAVLVTVLLSAIASAILLLAIKAIIGLRVKDEDEITGLDLTQHGEEGYHGLA
jgi:Amt family ammonium transporter